MAEKRADLKSDWFLGLGLRGARVSADIGLREAAEVTGLDISTIVRIENGLINPTLETLMKLVKLYRAVVEVCPDGTLVTWMVGEEQRVNEMPWWYGPANRDAWPR